MKLAQEKGIDVIITDHHEPHKAEGGVDELLPPAFAIVDHKQKDCKYPEQILCGSGVGFKLIQAIYFKEAAQREEVVFPRSFELMMLANAILIIILGIHPDWLMSLLYI